MKTASASSSANLSKIRNCYARCRVASRRLSGLWFGYPMDNIVPEIAEQQDASGIAFAPIEGIPATNVQGAMEIVAGLYTEQEHTLLRCFVPYTTGGTGNAYTITPSPAVTALTTGLSLVVMPDRAITGATTLNVHDLDVVNLQKHGRRCAGSARPRASPSLRPLPGGD